MEKRDKFKILKRILPIICAVLCIATALVTPIGAVINSSQGSYNNYDITGRSTFPMTVGFSYATRDLSTGAGASYVYSTYVGQYGVEFNDTKYGNEQYTLEYDPYGNGSTTYDVTGKLVYSLGAEEWGVSTEVETNSSYRLGRRRISMTNNTPESSNVAGLQQGVVLRADDIVFNPYTIIDSWEAEATVVGGQTVTRYVYYLKDEADWSYSVPSFLTPAPLAYTNNLGIEMIYSWSADVMDNNGTVRSYSGTATYDNRTTDYQQELVPIMSAEALLGQIGGYGNGGQISDTIVIEDYYGYLEYKYYEYVSPQIEFTLNGTTYACPDGMTWGEYANLDTTEYPASSNADVRWLDSADGTGMQFNNNGTWQFILYNGEVVENTDTIIGRAVYTLEEAPIEDELAGTWVLNRSMYFPLDFDTAKATVDGLSADERIDFLTLDCDIYINGTLDSKPTLAFYGSAFETRRGIYFGVTDGTTYTTYATFYNKQYETVTVNVNRAVSQASFEITNITNVSDKELALTWLKANATKQDDSLTSGGGSNDSGIEGPSASNDYDWGAALDAGPSASPASYTVTTIAAGTWNEVERSESAEFVLYYPLLDTSGVRITNTPAYNTYYERFSMPNMVKFRNTMGIPLPSLEVDYTSWIGTAVGGFLNMELMPNFSLGGILAILIAFAITMLFLKFFAGG